MLTNKQIEEMKESLLSKKNLLMQLSEQTQTDRQPVLLDQSSVGRISRMDSMQLQAMQIESEQRRQLSIKLINSALSRIEEKNYGYCVICEEPIAIERLRSDPAVVNCIYCAQKSS